MTTLQERIEERAKQKLLKDLYKIAQQEEDTRNFVGKDYPQMLAVNVKYGYDQEERYVIGNDYTTEVFNQKLPEYVADVTDEILSVFDQAKWLFDNPTKSLD